MKYVVIFLFNKSGDNEFEYGYLRIDIHIYGDMDICM